ncbi:protein of unknown function [Nitratireductor aquimarinus]
MWPEYRLSPLHCNCWRSVHRPAGPLMRRHLTLRPAIHSPAPPPALANPAPLWKNRTVRYATRLRMSFARKSCPKTPSKRCPRNSTG